MVTDIDPRFDLPVGAPSPGPITLRDYFAAQMMGPLYAECMLRVQQNKQPGWGWNELAREAYNFADAMLAHKEKR